MISGNCETNFFVISLFSPKEHPVKIPVCCIFLMVTKVSTLMNEE